MFSISRYWLVYPLIHGVDGIELETFWFWTCSMINTQWGLTLKFFFEFIYDEIHSSYLLQLLVPHFWTFCRAKYKDARRESQWFKPSSKSKTRQSTTHDTSRDSTKYPEVTTVAPTLLFVMSAKYASSFIIQFVPLSRFLAFAFLFYGFMLEHMWWENGCFCWKFKLNLVIMFQKNLSIVIWIID